MPTINAPSISADVVIDATELREFYRKFLSESGFKSAVSRGLNRTAEQARTIARTAVKQVYTITQKGVGNSIKSEISTPRTLQAFVKASASPVPMQEFKHQFISSTGAVQKIKKRIGANGQTIDTKKKPAKRKLGTFVLEAKRGIKVAVAYAFIIPTSTRWIFGRGKYRPGAGTWGFQVRKAGEKRERTNSGGTNEKISPLTSVTVHAAAINPKVKGLISAKVENIIVDKIVHELAYASLYDIKTQAPLKNQRYR